MTILNITIGSSFAVMCCDTLAVDAGVAAGFASKVMTVPHLAALVGGTGHWESVREFGALVRQTQSDDARWAMDEAPGACKAVASHFPDKAFRIVLAACLPDGRISCRAFDSEEDFEPVEIAGTHGYSPDVDMSDSDYDALAALSGPAIEDAEAAAKFHELLAANQYRSFKAGRVTALGYSIGGALIAHRLDADGMTIRRLMDFSADGPQEP